MLLFTLLDAQWETQPQNSPVALSLPEPVLAVPVSIVRMETHSNV